MMKPKCTALVSQIPSSLNLHIDKTVHGCLLHKISFHPDSNNSTSNCHQVTGSFDILNLPSTSENTVKGQGRMGILDTKQWHVT